MNNVKAQRRWELIKRSAEAPLQRVLDGTHTLRDVDSLGVALKNYDDLAFSVFAEALRVAEIQAQDRVQAVKDARTARDKAPLSAASLSKLYNKATDKAVKKALPVIITEVREALALSNKTLEDVDLPEQSKPVGAQAPLKLKQASLEKFADEKAANEPFLTDLHEVLGDTKESILAGIRDLHNANLVASNDMAFADPATPAPVPTSTAKQAVLDAKGSNNEVLARLDSIENSLAQTDHAQPGGDPAVPSKEEETAEKKRDGAVRRTLEFLKTKYSKIRNGASKASEFLGNALMIGLALAAIPPAIEGIVAAFKNISIIDVVKDTFNTIMGWIPNALSAICSKVMSWLGIGDLNKQPDVKNVDPGSKTDTRPVGERNYDWAKKTDDPNKVETKLSREEAASYMANKAFSPEEKEEFDKAHAKYKLKVPEDNVNLEYEDQETRNPTYLKKMKEEAMAARAQQPQSKASPAATPTAAPTGGSPSAPDGATGAGATMPKDTAQPNAEAPKTVASGGLSASSPMPLSTPSRGGGGEAAATPASRSPTAAAPPQVAQPKDKPVTATPPQQAPQQPQAQQSQQQKAQGTGEPKLGLGSVPNHSANSEVSLFVNAVPAM